MQGRGAHARVLGFRRDRSGGMAGGSGGVFVQAHEGAAHHGPPGDRGLSIGV